MCSNNSNAEGKRQGTSDILRALLEHRGSNYDSHVAMCISAGTIPKALAGLTALMRLLLYSNHLSVAYMAG